MRSGPEPRRTLDPGVEEALNSGPQTVTRRGEHVVVVSAIDTCRRVAGPVPSLRDFLRSAPLEGVDTSRDDGAPIASVGGDGYIRIWDLADLRTPAAG